MSEPVEEPEWECADDRVVKWDREQTEYLYRRLASVGSPVPFRGILADPALVAAVFPVGSSEGSEMKPTELDLQIHTQVMGRAVPYTLPHVTDMTGAPFDLGVPAYSTDMNAAWEVVEQMRRQISNFKLALYADNGWCCYFWDVTSEPREVERGTSGNQPTAPLAICQAALKVRP